MSEPIEVPATLSIDPDSLPIGPQGEQGEQGTQGDQGPQGETGPQGEAAPRLVWVSDQTLETVSPFVGFWSDGKVIFMDGNGVFWKIDRFETRLPLIGPVLDIGTTYWDSSETNSGNGYLISGQLPPLPYPCVITLHGDSEHLKVLSPVWNPPNLPDATIVASSSDGSNRTSWGPVTYSPDLSPLNSDDSLDFLMPLSTLVAPTSAPGMQSGPWHLEYR